MKPDYNRAAKKATELLISNGIIKTPIDPLPILKKFDNVRIYSFMDLTNHVQRKREDIVSVFMSSQDAITSVINYKGKLDYIVMYNQMLSYSLIQRAIARELGHIVMNHDGSLPEDVRAEEAKCFSHHLLCPSPLIHAIQAIGIRITTEVLGNLTGCYDRCLIGMRSLPANISVPKELNAQLRNQMMNYIMNYFDFQRHLSIDDMSAVADFGNYMTGYEE